MISQKDFNDLMERVANLEESQGGLGFPLDALTKGSLETANFAKLRALVLIGGLPIFTTARDVTQNAAAPNDSEMWLEDISGARKVCAFISGTKYCTPIVSGGLSSADVAAQTASVASVVAVTVPNDSTNHTYLIGGYLVITAINAATLKLQATYTDENNNSQTKDFFVEGVTAAVSTTGNYPLPAMCIRVKPNTTITMLATFAGVSITFDAGAFIQQLT